MPHMLVWSAPALVALVVFALWTYLSKRSSNTQENDPEITLAHTEKQFADLQTSTHGPEKFALPLALPAALPEFITNSNEDLIERGDWTQRLGEYIQREHHKSKFNVVVVNQEIQYRLNAEEIVEDFVVRYYETIHARVVFYRVVVFKRGVLINLGDGGYINWCGVGNVTRPGLKTLRFETCDSENNDN